MANLAKTGVTVVRSYELPSKPARILVRELTLVLSSMGSATNKVSAEVLGFNRILESSPAQKSDNTLAYMTAPSIDGSLLLFYNGAQATDADRPKPADLTGTFKVIVKGTK